jgi:ankyrin repeat protein
MDFTIDQLVIFAARSGNLQLLKERVRAGGDINYNDSSHGSALTAAILKGHLNVLDWLISNGADVNMEYHDGIGPLEVALRNPEPTVVYRLACAGAKLRKKTRPYYRERLEQCLTVVSGTGELGK